MNFSGNVDIFTIVIYVLVALSISFFTRKAVNAGGISSQYTDIDLVCSKIYWNIAVVSISMLTLFATFRLVGVDIGGRDTLGYIKDFLQATSGLSEKGTFFSERLFYEYLHVIRIFTDNYRVFFLISYLFISWSYMMYIKKYSRLEYSTIPYLLLVFLFIKGFSSVRTSLAVALITIGLVYIDKRRIFSFCLMVASVFVHRMSILFILVFLFYYLFKKYLCRITRIKLVIYLGIFIAASVVVSSKLRSIIMAFDWMSSTDLWYVSYKGISLLDKWPMWFAHALLLVCYLIVARKETETDKEHIAPVKIIFLFDLIILPMALTLGIYRANEFFFINRMVLWGYVINLGSNFFAKNSKQIYKIIVLCLFIAWFIFRLYSEGFDLGVMYYRFSIS